MIWKALFLASVLKGVDSYRRPIFWACLYIAFCFVTFDMFVLAIDHSSGAILKICALAVINFVLSASYFTALCALEGGAWLAVMGLGILLLGQIPN